jgi:hypothetical protein
MEILEDLTTMVSPKNPESQWITVDESGKLISEGKTPDEAISIAEKITSNFTVVFVPKQGNTYIF